MWLALPNPNGRPSTMRLPTVRRMSSTMASGSRDVSLEVMAQVLGLRFSEVARIKIVYVDDNRHRGGGILQPPLLRRVEFRTFLQPLAQGLRSGHQREGFLEPPAFLGAEDVGGQALARRR